MCLACYCCSWLVFSASRLERASFGQQCWARVVFALRLLSSVVMAVTWIALVCQRLGIVVSVPGILDAYFRSGLFVQIPGISGRNFYDSTNTT